ncbi:hypothetical protein [Microbacterium xylanilyticum]
MNRIVKRALWGTLIAGGITLAGATAANAAEAPPNGADCGCSVVSSTLNTVTNLVAGACDPSQGGGGTGGLPAVTQDVTDLVGDTVSTVTGSVPPDGGTGPGLPPVPSVPDVTTPVVDAAEAATDGAADTVSGVTEAATTGVTNTVDDVTHAAASGAADTVGAVAQAAGNGVSGTVDGVTHAAASGIRHDRRRHGQPSRRPVRPGCPG